MRLVIPAQAGTYWMRLVIPAQAGTYPFAPHRARLRESAPYPIAPHAPNPIPPALALYPRPNSLTLTRTR